MPPVVVSTVLLDENAQVPGLTPTVAVSNSLLVPSVLKPMLKAIASVGFGSATHEPFSWYSRFWNVQRELVSNDTEELELPLPPLVLLPPPEAELSFLQEDRVVINKEKKVRTSTVFFMTSMVLSVVKIHEAISFFLSKYSILHPVFG